MIKPRTARFLRRSLRDLTLGLMLFIALAGIGGVSANSSIGSILCNSAQARSYQVVLGSPFTPIPGLQLVSPTGPQAAASTLPSMPLLAVLFALVVAVDLWFLRHLSRVYASTRLGGWRRG